MRTPLLALLPAALLCFFVRPTLAQTAPDPQLLAEIMQIKAFDNHAHPLKVVGAGETDTEYDALPPEGLEEQSMPLRLRLDNPEFIAAWRELYGYQFNDMSEAHLRTLRAAKERVARAQGDNFPNWVLDRLHIETMLANRIAMGSGLAEPRFRWVWHANPLLFPLDNSAGKRSNPQRAADFTTDERWLRDFLAELGLPQLPATLGAYVDSVVVPLLERRRRDRAVAVKFYAAYQRSLAFGDPPEPVAARVYARYVRGGVPDETEYKTLQDYLFRRIARECGRLGLPVHIHTGAGAGAWFYNSGASPFLLDSVLNDPSLRGTTFVLVHGGLPFAAATRYLLGKPNVYADFSSQTFLTSTRELSQVLRTWLEAFPEKVLFGTDAYPLTTAVGWEEVGWIATRSARRALAIALTGMMEDGEISRARASEIARMVLRQNAVRLYGLE
jgi:predicted TIM-barrel fold metal-dependent hydrolase